MKTNYLVLFLFVFISGVAIAQEPSNLNEAAELMKNNQFQKAIEIYESVLKSGQSSSELHYNLGVAYHSKDQLGYALWHFLLAEKKGMNTASLKHNIQLTKEKRIDNIEIIEPFFLNRWWNAWKAIMGPNWWSLVSLVLLIIGIWGLTTWRIHTERDQRKRGFFFGTVGVFLAGVTLITAISSADHYVKPINGILLTSQAELRSAPDPASAAIMDIHEGIESKILDQIGDWVKIRLLNGQTGWILKSNLGLL